MIPLQELEITTNKKRIFHVHLEKISDTTFECKLAAINLGPQLPADACFGPFSKGHNAENAFVVLIQSLSNSLGKLDPEDSIFEINNPCNTEFLSKSVQQKYVQSNVVIKINGK